MELIIKSSRTYHRAQLGLDDLYHQESPIKFSITTSKSNASSMR
jgi:hypothetical protein